MSKLSPLALLTLLLCGCAARKVHDDRIGAPPNFEGKCFNDHFKKNPLTGQCERER